MISCQSYPMAFGLCEKGQFLMVSSFCVCMYVFFFFWLPTKSKFCCQSKGSDPLPRPLIKREKTDASVSFEREESATFSSAEVPRDPQGTIEETMELKKGINYGVSFETISKGKKNEQISTT